MAGVLGSLGGRAPSGQEDGVWPNRDPGQGLSSWAPVSPSEKWVQGPPSPALGQVRVWVPLEPLWVLREGTCASHSALWGLRGLPASAVWTVTFCRAVCLGMFGGDSHPV